jgi:hypothetical protein
MKTKILLLFIVIGVFSTSCEDFVTPEPKDRITIDIALADLDGVNSILVSAYNRLINFNNYGQRFMLVGDALADNIVVNNNTGRYTGEQINEVGAHMDIMNDPGNPGGGGFSVRSAYNAYKTINDCNIVIAKATELRDEDPAYADQMIGEAAFIRALSYHDLARVYGYEPGQEVGGFNLAVVLRTEPVFGATDADLRARSTNTEVYTQIKTDLNTAITLLEPQADVADAPFKASQQAAYALLARVYLYEGNWAQAITAADGALIGTTAVLTDDTNYISAWQSTTSHPESIFELAVSALDWNTVDGVNNSLATVTRTSSAELPNAQGAIRASDDLIASFEAGDIRRDLWVNPSAANVWEAEKWNGQLGDFRNNIPIIRYSEVLLIRAEAYARSGDDTNAQADVNLLRTSRNLLASSATGQSLLDLIMQERRVELALEGHRFFDLKRLGMDIPKPAASGLPDVAYSDFRILARINFDYLAVNPLLEQNPEY